MHLANTHVLYCLACPPPLSLCSALACLPVEQDAYVFMSKAYSLQHPYMGKSPLFRDGERHVHTYTHMTHTRLLMLQQLGYRVTVVVLVRDTFCKPYLCLTNSFLLMFLAS